MQNVLHIIAESINVSGIVPTWEPGLKDTAEILWRNKLPREVRHRSQTYTEFTETSQAKSQRTEQASVVNC